MTTTPEHWHAGKSEPGAYEIRSACGVLIGAFQSASLRDRAVADHNALAGIADPAASLKQGKEALRRISVTDPDSMGRDRFIEWAKNMAAEAFRALGG